MIVKLTDQERAALKALYDDYNKKFAAAQKVVEDYAPANQPDARDYYGGIDKIKSPEEWGKAHEQFIRAMDDWNSSAPEAYHDAKRAVFSLSQALNDRKAALIQQYGQRQFNELGGNLDVILADGKAQAVEIINATYNARKEWMEIPGEYSSIDIVALGGDKWQLDATETKSQIIRGLSFHFEVLRGDPVKSEELNQAIRQAVADSPYIAPEGTPGRDLPVTIGSYKRKAYKPNPRRHGEPEAAASAPVIAPAKENTEAPIMAERSLPGYDRVPMGSELYYVIGQFGNMSRPFTPASKTTTVSRKADQYGNQITMFETKEAQISFITKGLDKVSETAQKLFIYGFIMGERQGWRGNQATFTIDDFMQYLGEDVTKTKRDYYVGLFDAAASELVGHVLSVRYINGSKNNKRDALVNTPIVQKSYRERYTGRCALIYDPGVLAVARTYFAILPEWAGRVKNFYGQRLLWLVYYRMNCAQTGRVSINTRDMLEWLGLPTSKEQIADRAYSRKLYDPIQKALEAIENTAAGAIKIRPSDDGGEINAFMAGFTQFEADKDATKHYQSMRDKIGKRANKERKTRAKSTKSIPERPES